MNTFEKNFADSTNTASMISINADIELKLGQFTSTNSRGEAMLSIEDVLLLAYEDGQVCTI